MNPLTSMVASLGNYGIFLGRAFRSILTPRDYAENVLAQMAYVGVNSIPLVLASGIFTGVVMTIQTAYMLEVTILGPSAVGTVVIPTLMLELAALTTGLVMASKMGAGMAAQLGQMRVTEQVDALEAMGLNSVAYLVLPRVIAGTLMLPVLHTIALTGGIFAGAYVGELLNYLSFQEYILGGREWFYRFDLYFGTGKSAVFGFLIASIACWKGYEAGGGAQGVGKATTQAVVISCVVILFADYILADLLLPDSYPD